MDIILKISTGEMAGFGLLFILVVHHLVSCQIFPDHGWLPLCALLAAKLFGALAFIALIVIHPINVISSFEYLLVVIFLISNCFTTAMIVWTFYRFIVRIFDLKKHDHFFRSLHCIWWIWTCAILMFITLLLGIDYLATEEGFCLAIYAILCLLCTGFLVASLIIFLVLNFKQPGLAGNIYCISLAVASPFALARCIYTLLLTLSTTSYPVFRSSVYDPLRGSHLLYILAADGIDCGFCSVMIIAANVSRRRDDRRRRQEEINSRAPPLMPWTEEDEMDENDYYDRDLFRIE